MQIERFHLFLISTIYSFVVLFWVAVSLALPDSPNWERSDQCLMQARHWLVRSTSHNYTLRITEYDFQQIAVAINGGLAVNIMNQLNTTIEIVFRQKTNDKGSLIVGTRSKVSGFQFFLWHGAVFDIVASQHKGFKLAGWLVSLCVKYTADNPWPSKTGTACGGVIETFQYDMSAAEDKKQHFILKPFLLYQLILLLLP